ncbi:MAG: hypothetical protein WDM71_10380 [Ferruginibacter sp.]
MMDVLVRMKKDGLVVNHYVNSPYSKFTQLGWHTDSPRRFVPRNAYFTNA